MWVEGDIGLPGPKGSVSIMNSNGIKIKYQQSYKNRMHYFMKSFCKIQF